MQFRRGLAPDHQNKPDISAFPYLHIVIFKNRFIVGSFRRCCRVGVRGDSGALSRRDDVWSDYRGSEKLSRPNRVRNERDLKRIAWKRPPRTCVVIICERQRPSRQFGNRFSRFLDFPVTINPWNDREMCMLRVPIRGEGLDT